MTLHLPPVFYATTDPERAHEVETWGATAQFLEDARQAQGLMQAVERALNVPAYVLYASRDQQCHAYCPIEKEPTDPYPPAVDYGGISYPLTPFRCSGDDAQTGEELRSLC